MLHPRPLLCFFWFFSNNFKTKNCILYQSINSDRRSRRRACWPLGLHHGPPKHLLAVNLFKGWIFLSGIEPGIANWALRHPPIELRNVFLKKYHLSLSASFGHSISLTDSHSQSISFSLYLSPSVNQITKVLGSENIWKWKWRSLQSVPVSKLHIASKD